MATELKVKSGGLHRLITQPEVKFSSSWRQIVTVEVRSGGVWRTVFIPTVGNVTVSGEVISDIGSGDRLFRAALVVKLSGTSDKIVNTTQTQIDGATDWIIPNGDASSLYEVRYTGLTGDALDGSTSLAEDVWGSLGANKFFSQRWVAGAGIGMKSSVFTVEIRFNGGAPLDSASYTLNAERLF